MDRHCHHTFARLLVVAGFALSIACSNGGAPPPSTDTATVGFELEVAPGVSINTVSWTITNAGSGFSRSGSVNVQSSNTLTFQVGAVPTGAGYLISLTANSVDGVFHCAGSSTFSVTAGMTTPVAVTLLCSPGAADAGTVVVTGTTEICASIGGVSAAPLETAVGTTIALSATASAGTATPTFAWTAPAGTFDNAASATPVFTCPTTPGPVTITVTVGPSSPDCTTTSSQSVTVTCDLLAPTFTNVYATIIGVRCIGCHHPGGSGVTVGGLDMSTEPVAYANLVGVPAAGTGAGTSGVTCGSLAPGLLRVVPSDSADSLIYNKVASKLNGTLPPCGSPMPLPATGAPLTGPQVDLIKAWIDAGAMNN
jgi:hypothetical protein